MSFDWIGPIQIAKSKQTSKVQQQFDIRCQLEHFEYDMNRTLIFKTESESMYPPKVYIETNLHVAKDFGKHIV